MTRVLIADDQALVRGGFRAILDSQADVDVVGEAEDGRAAVRMARDLQPHVVLMDVRMPELDGIEATDRLLRDRVRSRVLMLTTFDLDEYVYRAFRAGARSLSSPVRHFPSAFSERAPRSAWAC